MNKQIGRLFVLVVILFALLIGWTSRWTVLQAKSLRNDPLNVRTLVQELRIKRGRILAVTHDAELGPIGDQRPCVEEDVDPLQV